jgi:hypothetical protein
MLYPLLVFAFPFTAVSRCEATGLYLAVVLAYPNVDTLIVLPDFS